MYNVCPPALRPTDPKIDHQNSDGTRTIDGLTNAMDGVHILYLFSKAQSIPAHHTNVLVRLVIMDSTIGVM